MGLRFSRGHGFTMVLDLWPHCRKPYHPGDTWSPSHSIRTACKNPKHHCSLPNQTRIAYSSNMIITFTLWLLATHTDFQLQLAGTHTHTHTHTHPPAPSLSLSVSVQHMSWTDSWGGGAVEAPTCPAYIRTNAAGLWGPGWKNGEGIKWQ